MYFETTIVGKNEATLKSQAVKYLVEAETFGEAEEKSYKEAQTELTDLSVRSIKRSRIQVVSKVDNGAEGYFCCIIATQGDSDKLLRTRALVPADSLIAAEKSIRESDVFDSGYDTVESVIATPIQAVL